MKKTTTSSLLIVITIITTTKNFRLLQAEDIKTNLQPSNIIKSIDKQETGGIITNEDDFTIMTPNEKTPALKTSVAPSEIKEKDVKKQSKEEKKKQKEIEKEESQVEVVADDSKEKVTILEGREKSTDAIDLGGSLIVKPSDVKEIEHKLIKSSLTTNT